MAKARISGHLLAAKAGPFIVWDTEVKGLCVRRQTDAGRVTYAFRYTDGRGRKRQVIIGDASHFSPDEARRAAKAKAKEDDPAAARESARSAKTLAYWWEDYRDRVLHKKAIATQVNYQSLWSRHLEPALGAKIAAEITTGDVEDIHKNITKLALKPRPKGAPRQGGAYAANRAKALLSILMNRAKVSPNPCADVEANEEFRRNLTYTDAELSFIMAAVEEEDLDVQIAFDFFLTTPLRHKTVASAEWLEFRDLTGDDPHWQIPRVKLKGKDADDYIVWLSPDQAQRILKWRRRMHNESPRYVFPLTVELRKAGKVEVQIDPERPRVSYRSAWERIRARAIAMAKGEAVHMRALKQGTIHTFKHSYLTRFADQGATAAEVQQAGDHKSIQTSMIYVHGLRRRGRELHERTRANLPSAAKVR